MPTYTPLRCSAEIPQSADPTACDAIVCNALASVICEEGARCQSCYQEFGGTLVTNDQKPISQPAQFDLGSLMATVIDTLRA